MYTTNPKLPKLRAQAVDMVRQGKSMRQVARYYGFNVSTISRWCQKAPFSGCHYIPTRSSRPHSHPRQLSLDIVRKIVELRIQTNGRCSEVIHQMLVNQGIEVSLNSVKRILDRNKLLKKRSPWKRYHPPTKRPKIANPGDLVEVDTIHLMMNKYRRIYVYTLMDVYSRWTYALAVNKISSGQTIRFFKQAKDKASFDFQCIQSDHGPEFSQYFTERIKIKHHHSRVRKPNDNAHLERFNRTIQQELLDKLPKDVNIINRCLPKYLKYYNEERLHLGINLRTPNDLLSKCCQAIG
jgi:transposase InsO family protein